MQQALVESAPQIAAICRQRHVRRLAVFGSAATDQFVAGKSDIDLLVELEPMPPVDHADTFFKLLDDLERLLGIRVDLVEAAALRNPYVRRSVERTQVPLYESA